MSIAQDLACGQPVCPCARTARTENGVTHCPVPGHGKGRRDRKPSLSVTPRPGRLPLVHCKAGCSQDEVIVALQSRGLWGNTSSTPLAQPPRRREWHAYHATTLKYVSTHVRIDKPGEDKKVWWEPKGRTVKDLALYRAAVLPANPGLAVVVCEGEPATDALATIEEALGIVAVGTVTGAGTIPNDAAFAALAGHTVYLWPDNDTPGRQHMAKIASRLHARGGQDIRIINWPDAPPDGRDAAQAVDLGVDVKGLLTNAQVWRADGVNLSELLGNVVEVVHRYVVLTEAQADAYALWVAHTHAFEAAECTPYLSINSAEKQSGKTRLLEVSQFLVARPWFTSHATTAALVRKVARDAPSLLLDETDAAFEGNSEYAEALRGMLNAGYRQGGVASLCVKSGGNWDVVDYPVFCPKALAGIGKSLPDTVADRSINIEMRRKAPGESTQRFLERDVKVELKPVHDSLAEWAIGSITGLLDARPDMPPALDDRAVDVWEPLMAIADMAGGDWPHRAREAALVLSVGTNREDESIGVALLRDIRNVFQDREAEEIATPELVAALVSMEEAPWGDLKGREIDARRLARMLKPFAIKPSIWRDGEKTTRGYRKVDFVDTWVRYVSPSETGETSETDDVPVPSNVSLVSVVSDDQEDSEWSI